MASVFSKLLARAAQGLDGRFGWHRLPRPLGVLTLIGLRTRLRERNLYDTGLDPGPGPDGRTTSARTLDGTYNDLERPLMGSIGARFGRNVPLEATWPESEPGILEPNPRVVSRELLTRREFIPAEIVNVLAAAWLQFEVHDWFSHGKPEPEAPWTIDVADDDPWAERPMRIPRTRRDPGYSPASGTPPTFVTADSHWWDGSQIYGSRPEFADALRAREDGKLRLGPDGLLPRDLEEAVDLTDVGGNLWIGLGVLHTLFTLEHNAICDRLREEYPTWTDDELYDRARLVNAALMAKIHTVEWTPAIIAHPTTRYAMHANWWGLVGERLGRRLGRLGSSEVLSGIPGSPTDHHGVPYSLTEEFVAVYRMHPLLPDDYTFRSFADDSVLEERTFREVGALETRACLERIGLANVAYSLGVAHPGAITLHNYPRFLQEFRRPDGTTIDLAATDIMRVRERGVPRYNDFRRHFRLEPAESFESLTANAEWAEELRRVYGDVERVDLMVGLYAEPFPKGFGFSDTAFRVFILMASRRLKSDRFFTRDYTPEVYTRAGLDWINESSMVTVLLRHFPELAPALRGVENAFAPWKRVGR
ncbi:MAG TPA: peroxidase family protein [Gaiellaceae bacterium]|nr:peroxidase family protein [Gaiellaceae bacterium]